MLDHTLPHHFRAHSHRDDRAELDLKLELTLKETHRALLEVRVIREQRNREAEYVKTQIAVADQQLKEAIKEWQRMNEELTKARNEQ